MYDFRDYKLLIQHQVEKLQKPGVWKRLAEQLEVQPVVVSQIFKGVRELSDEHAYLTCEFFEFSDPQREYFMTLVRHNKSAHFKLKNHLAKKLEKLRLEALKPSNHVDPKDKKLEKVQPLYYSDWRYAFLRVLTFLSGKEDDIIKQALKLDIPPPQTTKLLHDLVHWGVLSYEKKTYVSTQQRLHVPEDSILINQHLLNWRLHGVKKIHSSSRGDNPILYSSLVSLDSKTANKIKADITGLIQSISKNVKNAPSEEVHNLNIDFFKLV